MQAYSGGSDDTNTKVPLSPHYTLPFRTTCDTYKQRTNTNYNYHHHQILLTDNELHAIDSYISKTLFALSPPRPRRPSTGRYGIGTRSSFFMPCASA